MHEVTLDEQSGPTFRCWHAKYRSLESAIGQFLLSEKDLSNGISAQCCPHVVTSVKM